MKDYIDMARRSLDATVRHMRDGETSDASLLRGLMIAQTDAAIAQAEQLKRIADMMEEDRKIAKTDQDARAYVAQVKYGR